MACKLLQMNVPGQLRTNSSTMWNSTNHFSKNGRHAKSTRTFSATKTPTTNKNPIHGTHYHAWDLGIFENKKAGNCGHWMSETAKLGSNAQKDIQGSTHVAYHGKKSHLDAHKFTTTSAVRWISARRTQQEARFGKGRQGHRRH